LEEKDFINDLKINAEIAHVNTMETDWQNRLPYKQMIEEFLKKGKHDT